LVGKALANAIKDQCAREFAISSLVEQLPDKNNRVLLSRARKDGLGIPVPKIEYSLGEYEHRGLAESLKVHKFIYEAMDATETNAFEGDYNGAGHIMGTCVMGDNPKDSVVDKDLRCHDHKNLFIVGSSSFPTSAAANPTLTIGALSLRTADVMLRELI